ncbi:MAG TPA: hypothetical protein VJN02_03995 [Gammaproteobacteria bacterium]|nr:hypothetical protein [Gammaproteobacteria bacterium]
MDFIQFKDWVLIGLLSSIGPAIVYILWKMYGSIENLNIKIAVVLERLNSHEKRIKKLETNK